MVIHDFLHDQEAEDKPYGCVQNCKDEVIGWPAINSLHTWLNTHT